MAENREPARKSDDKMIRSQKDKDKIDYYA